MIQWTSFTGLLLFGLAACATPSLETGRELDREAPVSGLAEVHQGPEDGVPLPPAPVPRTPSEPVEARWATSPPPAGPWLAWPEPAVLRAVSPRLAEILTALRGAPSPLSPAEVETLLPGLLSGDLWLSEDLIAVDGVEAGFGAIFIPRRLAEIRARDRDQVAYLASAGRDLETSEPVAGTYRHGHDSGLGPWVSLTTRQTAEARLGCDAFELRIQSLERWEDQRYVVTFRDLGSDTLHFGGRDTYFRVTQGDNFRGWLILSSLGFDIADCWDRDRDVLQSIRDTLVFLSGAGAPARALQDAPSQSSDS